MCPAHGTPGMVPPGSLPAAGRRLHQCLLVSVGMPLLRWQAPLACFLPCLQAVQQTCYDVLLLDLRMPRMNGVEAATHIAHEVPPQRQPRWIFALTADMLSTVEGPCRDAGEQSC